MPVSCCRLISWLKSKTSEELSHQFNWLDRCLDQRPGKISLKEWIEKVITTYFFPLPALSSILILIYNAPLLHLHVTIPSWAAENALSPSDPVKFSLVMHFGSRLTIVLGGQVAHKHQNMNGWPSFVRTRHRKWFLKVIVCVGYQADSHRSIGCDH